MREISIRNKQGDVNQSQPVSVPQLEKVNKPKERTLAKDQSRDSLIISPRDHKESPGKDSLHSYQNGMPPVQSHRQQTNVYKSQNHSPNQIQYQHRDNQNLGPLQRKPRVNYPGNMAYINISNDGNRLVGPLGMKKAEAELIKRRYKYQHYSNN